MHAHTIYTYDCRMGFAPHFSENTGRFFSNATFHIEICSRNARRAAFFQSGVNASAASVPGVSILRSISSQTDPGGSSPGDLLFEPRASLALPDQGWGFTGSWLAFSADHLSCDLASARRTSCVIFPEGPFHGFFRRCQHNWRMPRRQIGHLTRRSWISGWFS